MKSIFSTWARLTAMLLLPFVIVLSAQVAAVDVFPACSGNAASTDVCKNVNDPANTGQNPIIDGLETIIVILSIIIGIASVIMIIIGGLSMITANGDAQAVARARSGIIYALIGLVIVALAQTLVAFVLK